MDPIVAYLKDHPEIIINVLAPAILGAVAWAVAKLDALGPTGHAVADILRGFGFDAGKVKGGLLTLWAIARGKPAPFSGKDIKITMDVKP